jgi:replication-associated recombination protein RarA
MRPATTSETNVFELKPLSKEGIDGSLEKAEHYRLLNQPHLAESICLDILLVSPDDQRASTILLLALTDQFDNSASKASQAMGIARSLKDEYSRIYYSGIIAERRGAAALKSRTPGSDFDAYEWYREAMELFEKADAINIQDNNDPILRWNTCARLIMEHHLSERPADNLLMQE